MKQTNSLYLPGLNGLRFFAAFAVIITHLELIKSFKNMPNFWNTPLGKEAGPLGVIFFFVLSGFLITFLLLNESQKNGKISFKNFYLRRIFRIFPLYYLVMFLGFFVFFRWDFIYMKFQHPSAEENFFGYFLMYLFLIPNVTLSFYETSFPHIGQLWSIGVEEHFYIIWPFLLSLFSKRPIKMMIWFLVFVVGVKAGFWLSFQFNLFPSQVVQGLKTFLATEKLECMAIGGIAAYFYFNHKESINKIFNKPVYFLGSFLLVILGIHIFKNSLQDAAHLLYSGLFVIMIFVAIQQNIIGKLLEFKWFNYLGQISFGIYVYHLVIVTITFRVLTLIDLDYYTFNVLYYLISIGLTILVSFISYKYFETPFLKLKTKFKSL